MGEIPGETDKKLSDNHKQIPTGITQNVKDLLSSREVENIFENSDFVYMLNQAGGDRQILAKQLGISTVRARVCCSMAPRSCLSWITSRRIPSFTAL